jgi:ferric-dicitrate binding protein FerR (iron transport regulator)
MENKELIILLEKYSNGQLSAAEVTQLMQLLCDDTVDELVQQHIAGRLQGSSHQYAMLPETEAALLQTLLQETTRVPPPPARKPLFIRIAKYAAAAAVLAGIAVTLILLYPAPEHSSDNPTAQTLHPILPGGNRATLTLANGSVIDLDSAGLGVLAHENGANITRQNSGNLIYEKNGAAGSNGPVAFNTLRTPRGGQFQVTLPDGSRVWLNAASSLRYPTAFAGNTRQVEVTGEAYFEIAAQKAQPFIVTAPHQQVQVLGTRFNINTYEDEAAARTTLLEGSVKVQTAAHTNGFLLTPGQQLKIQDNNADVTEVAAEDAIAWKNGYFSFNHSSIPAIMRQLSRWYNVDIVIQGNHLDKQTFTGEIEKKLPLQEVLNGLGSTHIHYKMEANNQLIIIP